MAKNVFRATVKVELAEPIEWQKKSIDSISLDFSKINLGMIKTAARKSGGDVGIDSMQTDPIFLSHIAGYLSQLHINAIDKLCVRDGQLVCLVITSYFGNQNPQVMYDKYVAEEESGGHDIFTDETDDTNQPDSDNLPFGESAH